MAIFFFFVSIIFWSIYYFYQFQYGEVNLVDFSIIDHMLKNTCEGNVLQAPVPNSRAIVHNHLSIHITPLLGLILPFKCFLSSPLVISFFQAIIFSSTFFVLDKILLLLKYSKVQRIFGNLSLLIFPFCFKGMVFNFHYEVFYLPLGFLFLYFYLQKKNYHLKLFFRCF